MNKCTLLIDGNWLVMSRQSRVAEGFAADNPEEVKNATKSELIDLMARSISFSLARFEGIVDNVVLVADGKSWRKSVEKPEALEHEYKGTRKRAETTDWDKIFESLHDMEDKFRSIGITVSHTKNAEGDDAIWYWSQHLNRLGTNCIIWSSDNDLKQLVRYDGTAWTVWFNDRTGLFAPLSMTADDEIDFFMECQDTSMLLEDLRRKAETQMTYIEPESITMEKIICGDKSDNIKSVVRYKKSGKEYRITESVWSEVRRDLKIESLSDFFEKRNRILSELLEKYRPKGVTMTETDCVEQFEYNKKLVWLNSECIPAEVVSEMDSVEYKMFDVSSASSNYRVLTCEDNSEIEDLFIF